MSRKLDFSRKRKSLRNKRILMGVLSLVVLFVIGFGATVLISEMNKDNPSGGLFTTIKNKIFLSDNSSNQNLQGDKQQEEEQKEPEPPKPLPTDLVEGSNTSIEGSEYVFSGFDAQLATKYKLEQDGNKIAFLTFDDGPSENTPEILDILKEKDVKASFFVWAKTLYGKEEIREYLKRELKEGHAIGNHSYSHDYNLLYPGRKANLQNILEDFDKANNKFKEVLGEDFETRVIRFPGGAMSWKEMDAAKKAFEEKGIAYVDWNIDSTDAKSNKRTKEQILKAITEELESLEANNVEKITILMHDAATKKSTVEALPEIIDLLKSKGYEFRTLSTDK